MCLDEEWLGGSRGRVLLMLTSRGAGLWTRNFSEWEGGRGSPDRGKWRKVLGRVALIWNREHGGLMPRVIAQ
jgi:hypothetical protein